jgi:hypothetical protein
MKKSWLFLWMIALICYSCRKDKAVANEIASVASIPMTVGSIWTYRYVDDFSGQTDTMLVSALSKSVSQFGDSLIMLQRKTTLFGIDTVYVFLSNTSVTYYTDKTMTSVFDKYLLPLRLGFGWSDRTYSSDTTWVDGYPGSIAYYGIHYDSTYITRRQASDSVYNLISLSFIKPGIGIIYQSNTEYTSYSYGYDLYLLSYHIAN